MTNGTADVGLPGVFCWTKYGAEAGEPPERILERKEHERSANGGTFLWGIGNSLRPSLIELLDHTEEPSVCFSPMLSQPSANDVNPRSVDMWHSGIGIDGTFYKVPEYSVVTSRSGVGSKASRHFALVCSSVTPVIAAKNAPTLALDELRNLRTGSKLGSSQVTSVVRYQRCVSELSRNYAVKFIAQLTPPYFVVLTDRTEVPADVRFPAQADTRGAWERLVEFKQRVSPTQTALPF